MIRSVAVAAAVLLAGCSSGRGGDEPEPFEPSFPYCFEGNTVKCSELIESAIVELEAFERQGRSAADVEDAAWSMRRALRRLGYAHATVTPRMAPSERDVQSVTFVIVEGPMTRWGTITFPGARARDEWSLRKFVVSEPRKPGLLEPDPPPEPFRASDLDAGIARVEAVYLADGYYRVRAGPPKITWSEDRSVADVAIPIEENRRYVVGGVEVVIEGEYAAADALRAAAKALEGEPYHARIPIRAAVAVREMLAREGHVLAKVEPSATVDDQSATAAVKVKVLPGPRVMIRDVRIEGTERTKNHFVLERARLEAGQMLTGGRLERAIDGLYATGLFKSVVVEPVVPEGTASRPSTEAYDAEVAIRIEELIARTIDFEVGWGSYELLRGSVRYRDRNLFGIGRDFEVEPAASVKSVGLDVRFFDRYLLGPKNTLELLTGVLYRQEPSYDLKAFRNELAVRRRIDEHLTLRGGWRFVLSNADNVRVEDDPATRDVTITSGPFATLEYDRRDNPLLPRKGYAFDLGAALSTSVLGANLNFVDLYTEASVYFELGEDLVLGMSTRGQTRPTTDGSETLPIQERLFLGGANSVRSFGEDELGPSDSNGDPIGGLTTFEATIELRQRLFGDLHGAIFYDIGSVGDRAFELDGFGQAIGVGLRYYLPMGPIRLDVGYNPGPWFAADSDVAVHFSFGFSF